MKKHANFIARFGIVLAAFFLVAFTPFTVYAISYDIHNFLILVDDQLILKGPANVNCCLGAPAGVRSDLGSRNRIYLGGTGSTNVPVGAPVLKDVAVIAPNIRLANFAKVSMVIWDKATGSFVASGTGIVKPSPANIFNNIGNNALNDTKNKDLPAFPAFPNITPAAMAASDIVVADNASLDLSPGIFRDLIIGVNSNVNFTTTGIYQFRRIIANTPSSYNLTMKQPDIQIYVKEFVHLAAFGDVNPTGKSGLKLYVEGFDGVYGGANISKKGVVRNSGTFPAAFEYGGEGTFVACFAFVKNGTINLQGITQYPTQWFGNSLQEISTLTTNLQSPGQVCFQTVTCP